MAVTNNREYTGWVHKGKLHKGIEESTGIEAWKYKLFLSS